MFLVLAVGVLEVVLRLSYLSISQITGVAEWKTSEWGGIRYEWDQYHERLGWVNVPSYRSGPAIPFKVAINDQGLRGTRNYTKSPQVGVKRIAVFGDSCVFGEEVDGDQTVPAHLERLLPSTEVLNFGVHGYGVGQMGMLLESRIDDFNPNHVVLMILIPEDIARDSSDFLGHAKPSFALGADGRVEVRNTPVPEATRQPWIYRNCYSAAWLLGRARALETSPNLGQQMQMLHGMLAQMKSKCEKMGAGFTVVPIVVAGSIERARRDPSHRQAVEIIRTSLQSGGFEILDLVGPLAESYAREGEKLVAPVAHWSSRGNCLIAMRVAEYLARKLPDYSDKVRADGCENDS